MVPTALQPGIKSMPYAPAPLLFEATAVQLALQAAAPLGMGAQLTQVGANFAMCVQPMQVKAPLVISAQPSQVGAKFAISAKPIHTRWQYVGGA